MRRRALSTHEEEEEPLINLTPLIDVVFVVLISFMILAPLLEIESVDLAQSGSFTQKEKKENFLSISIQKDASLWIRGKKVSLQELEALLKQEKGKTPQLALDKQAPFGAYQEVKNLLEDLGFSEMEILLKPR